MNNNSFYSMSSFTYEYESDYEEEKFVYKCKNPIGCTKTFMRRSDYLKHCQNSELCEVPVVKQSSNDQIVKLWISKNGISQEIQGKSYKETRNMIFHKELLPTIDPLFLNSAQKEELEIGHALPKGRKNTRFSEEQTQFLTEKFRSGIGAQKHKRKKIPQIALEMQMKFDRKDWLTETQIQGFFVRMAAKQKLKDPNDQGDNKEEREPTNAELDDANNLLQAIEEVELADEINEGLEKEDSIDDPHPFFVEGLDEGLCSLAKDMQQAPSFEESKLSEVSKKLLLKVMRGLDIPVNGKMSKQALGQILLTFIHDKCGCLLFLEEEN